MCRYQDGMPRQVQPAGINLAIAVPLLIAALALVVGLVSP